MNSTKLAARMVGMAKQLRGEADRWSGGVRRDLIAASSQLTYRMRAGYGDDVERAKAEQLLRLGEELLVQRMTDRAVRFLDEQKAS